jgi:hypothetical protein
VSEKGSSHEVDNGSYPDLVTLVLVLSVVRCRAAHGRGGKEQNNGLRSMVKMTTRPRGRREART